jgi:hypothetical protein
MTFLKLTGLIVLTAGCSAVTSPDRSQIPNAGGGGAAGATAAGAGNANGGSSGGSGTAGSPTTGGKAGTGG